MITNEQSMAIHDAFPKMFINYNLECIIYPPTNEYFRLEDVNSELDLRCKMLEWISRTAHKGQKKAKKYCKDGLSKYFNHPFTEAELEYIYTYVGNNVNKKLCIELVEKYSESEVTHEDISN